MTEKAASTARSSKNSDHGETHFIGSNNIEEGVLVKGTFTKRFEKEAVGKNGKFISVTYFFQTKDGNSVGINKLGNLGYLMDKKISVKEGETVEVEYNGRDENGYHNFDVSVI